MTDIQFAADVHRAFVQAEDLLMEKHRGYGPKNIADAPGGPLNGLRVRLYDKMARLNNMVDKGIDTAADESLRDTALDICNYGLIMLLVLDGKWPGKKPALVSNSDGAILQGFDVNGRVEISHKDVALRNSTLWDELHWTGDRLITGGTVEFKEPDVDSCAETPDADMVPHKRAGQVDPHSNLFLPKLPHLLNNVNKVNG